MLFEIAITMIVSQHSITIIILFCYFLMDLSESEDTIRFAMILYSPYRRCGE